MNFKPFMYFPDSDTLEITLANVTISETENVGVDGEHKHILFHYDSEGHIASITIDLASEFANISEIAGDDTNIVTGGPSEIFTVSSLAKKWGIQPRTIQKAIKAMTESGVQVGLQAGPNDPIVLTDEDAKQIQKWRDEHPRGRPVKPELTE
jgi:uncharacterized protein YuzE